MNTTTLALGALGVYFLTRPQTAAAGPGTGSTGATSPDVVPGSTTVGTSAGGGTPVYTYGASTTTLAKRHVEAYWQVSGFPASGAHPVNGMVHLEPAELASVLAALTAFGVGDPRAELGTMQVNGKWVMRLAVTDGRGGQKVSKQLPGIGNLDRIMVWHPDLMGTLSSAGANAAGDYVADKLKTLLPK